MEVTVICFHDLSCKWMSHHQLKHHNLGSWRILLRSAKVLLNSLCNMLTWLVISIRSLCLGGCAKQWRLSSVMLSLP